MIVFDVYPEIVSSGVSGYSPLPRSVVQWDNDGSGI